MEFPFRPNLRLLMSAFGRPKPLPSSAPPSPFPTPRSAHPLPFLLPLLLLLVGCVKSFPPTVPFSSEEEVAFSQLLKKHQEMFPGYLNADLVAKYKRSKITILSSNEEALAMCGRPLTGPGAVSACLAFRTDGPLFFGSRVPLLAISRVSTGPRWRLVVHEGIHLLGALSVDMDVYHRNGKLWSDLPHSEPNNLEDQVVQYVAQYLLSKEVKSP